MDTAACLHRRKRPIAAAIAAATTATMMADTAAAAGGAALAAAAGATAATGATPPTTAPTIGGRVPKKALATEDGGAVSFHEWVYGTWLDQLHLETVEGSRAYKKFLNSMDIRTSAFSGAIRAPLGFHILKFGYPMRPAGYVTATFTVQVVAKKKKGGAAERILSAYYAYAYWPRVRDDGGTNADGAGAPPEYICLSPTYESQDGEYRHRFLLYKDFDKGYAEQSALLAPIEGMLLQGIQLNEIRARPSFYPTTPMYGVSTKGPQAYCKNTRLGVKALAAAMAVDAMRAKSGTLENHASEGYVEVMRALYERRPEIIQPYTVLTLDRLAVFVTGKTEQPYRTQCGQKLIPLTVREALAEGDMNFAPWREVWVSQRATDLIINGIAPTFPIYNGWTYLFGVDETLFENRKMRNRYKRSAAAEVVSHVLDVARDGMKRLDGAVAADYHYEQLDAHVYATWKYTQDFLLLTDLALCSTSEYVGLTVRTVPDVVRRDATVAPSYARMYGDPVMQARYLFDLCYGAHMLHTRVGAVHSDLHLNNMTIHEHEHQYPLRGKPRFKNPTIAYIAGRGGETDTYVFPHDGWYATLIDFSRAILGPAAVKRIAEEKSEDFAASYFRSQVSRTLRVLEFYAPSQFVRKHQEKIKGLLLAEPDIMFAVLTAVDFVAIGKNYGALLQQLADGDPPPTSPSVSTAPLSPHRGWKSELQIAPEGLQIAAHIEEIALEHLNTHLVRLVEESDGGCRQEGVEHAGVAILPQVFGQYRYTTWARAEKSAQYPYPLSEATLTDVYNGAAPLRYASGAYERFPPWARFEEIEPHLGSMEIEQITSGRGKGPFDRSQAWDGFLEMLKESVRLHHISDGAPGGATSSWIAR